MASENGQQTDLLANPLVARLRDEPWAFDFFQALRLLENEFRDRPRIGRGISPAEDALRFGQQPELGFATSTLAGMEPGRDGAPPRLNVRFFGLLGPNGPMPMHITEHARERERNFHDPTLSAFLDVFHHRLISLFYRAWAVNQKAADFDRPADARFAGYVGSFLGIAPPAMRNRDGVPDDAKRFFAGRLAAQTRNVEGLEAILGDFFGTPVEIETLRGQWLPIPERYHCRLGASADSATLGENSIVGERIWDVHNSFRIRLGPMSYARFPDFLPVGGSFRRLGDWVALYTSHQFHWDVQVVLAAAEVPATQLGGGSRLGWTTWLESRPRSRDADDLILDSSRIHNSPKPQIP